MTAPRGPVYRALTAAGYVRLPPLWVMADDIPRVQGMADKVTDEVNRIRGEANGIKP